MYSCYSDKPKWTFHVTRSELMNNLVQPFTLDNVLALVLIGQEQL